MEACASAHHWARKLITLGLDARIIAAHRVSPYRLQGKSGKNDANDAAAICEAASRPSMRFVCIKTVAQRSKVPHECLSDVIEDASNELAGMARLVIERAQSQWRELDEHIAWCDARIAAHIKDDEQVRAALQLSGVGPITASAVVVTVGYFKQSRIQGRRAV